MVILYFVLALIATPEGVVQKRQQVSDARKCVEVASAMQYQFEKAGVAALAICTAEQEGA
jgi:hypothetical protein